MKNKKLAIILLIAWLIIIYLMSSFDGTQSGAQSGRILLFINNFFHFKNLEMLHMIIRKMAHVFEYFILGILTYNALKFYPIKYKLIITIIFCIICATFDECHQMFVSGRSGNIKDTMIDTFGSLIGTFLSKKLIKN